MTRSEGGAAVPPPRTGRDDPDWPVGTARASKRPRVHQPSSASSFGTATRPQGPPGSRPASQGWELQCTRELCQPTAVEEWRPPDASALPASAQASARALVCALAVDKRNELCVSASVGKVLRVHALTSRACAPGGGSSSTSSAATEGLAQLHTPSKLSCAAWSVVSRGVVACGDYDGTFALYDMERGRLLREEHHHRGRRVWGLSASVSCPGLVATASEEGTVRLWREGEPGCAMAVRLRHGAAASCVAFLDTDHDEAGSDGGRSNWVAVGGSDHSVRVFDVRRADAPLWHLLGHAGAVAHVRHQRSHRLVSSGTDGTLRLWDLSERPPQGTCMAPAATLKGHTNAHSFCGLAVRPDGLAACGSESDAVYAYRTDSSAAPLATRSLGSGGYVTAVAWLNGPRPRLVAASSLGHTQLLSLVPCAAMASSAPPGGAAPHAAAAAVAGA
mmetsp:Transcript_9043/g.31489  ORF Transcript_9043/g.31489 Transcript_9043/m.31489 type:complete len:447 (-) Transcript_9043:3001-4341(-)